MKPTQLRFHSVHRSSPNLTIAARAVQRNPYASSRDPYATGSLGGHKTASHKHGEKVNEEDEFEDE